MATHFYPLSIQHIEQLTTDSVAITFAVPEALLATFAYKAGQNITLRTHIDGDEVRRSYSICTAPHENKLTIAVKKVENGLFSTYANKHLKIADVIDVMPPTGNFSIKTNTGNYLGIASGSGITPIMGIIKHVLHTQPNSSFTLLYGNKNRSSIIFFEALTALKNTYMQRFNYINVLSREHTDSTINYGRIDTEKLAALQATIPYASYTHAYLCGPQQMIFTCADYLATQGIAKNNIHFELFGSVEKKPIVQQHILQPTLQSTPGEQLSQIIIRLDGRSTSFTLSGQGQSILTAALEYGADLPFACKAGVCCTCRAKLIEGKVTMDVNYALEADELAQGFILTCQSHPLTPTVVIDFDVK